MSTSARQGADTKYPQSLIEHVSVLQNEFDAVCTDMIQAFISTKPLSRGISTAIKDAVSTGLDQCLSEGALQEFSSNGAKGAAESVIANEVIRLISGHMDGKIPQDQFISLHKSFKELSNKVVLLQNTNSLFTQFPKKPVAHDVPRPDLDKALSVQPAGMTMESGSDDAFVGYDHQRPDRDARRVGEIEGATEAVNRGNVNEIQEVEAEDIEAGADDYSEEHDEGQDKQERRSQQESFLLSDHKIVIGFRDQSIVYQLKTMEIRDISRQVRQAIAEDPRIPEHAGGSPWILLLNQLENGNLELFTETLEDRNFLRQDMSWALTFRANIFALIETYSILMLNVQVVSMDFRDHHSKAKIIEELARLNSKADRLLGGPEDIKDIHWLRGASLNKEVAGLVVKFRTPEIDNEAMERNLYWDGANQLCRVHPAVSTGLKHCIRCQEYNHTAINCSAPHKCGKCAKAHATRDCTSHDLRCAGCGKPHWAENLGSSLLS